MYIWLRVTHFSMFALWSLNFAVLVRIVPFGNQKGRTALRRIFNYTAAMQK